MVTIFFGANDICSAQCYDKEKASARNHIRKLVKALDYLQAHLPRTFVNLIPVLGTYIFIPSFIMSVIYFRLQFNNF